MNVVAPRAVKQSDSVLVETVGVRISTLKDKNTL